MCDRGRGKAPVHIYRVYDTRWSGRGLRGGCASPQAASATLLSLAFNFKMGLLRDFPALPAYIQILNPRRNLYAP